MDGKRKRIIIVFGMAAVLFAAQTSAEAQEKAPEKTDTKTNTETDGSAENKGNPDDGEKVEMQRDTAITARLVLKVIQPREVIKTLIEESKKCGGHPTRITNTQLVLKVPRDRLMELMELAGAEGWLIDKQISREDLHRTIIDLSGRIGSKGEVLDKLRQFFDGSDVSATIDIERRMNQLVTTIEGLKGQLRVALERARYGVLTIDFQFRKGDKVVYTSSPFGWINSVDLDTFLTEF